MKSAETLALVNGIDEAIYLKEMLTILLDIDIKIVAFTDNHGLKESIYSTRALTERRMERCLEFVRECISTGELEVVKWVDTHSMLADCLTKSGVKADLLVNLLKSGVMTDEQYLNFTTQSCGEQLYVSTNLCE